MFRAHWMSRELRVRRVVWMLALAAALVVTATPAIALPGSMLAAREGHTATVLADGRVLVVGGENAGGVLQDAEWIDPDRPESQPAATPIWARTEHTATLLADGRVLIAGGRNATGSLDTTEIYDPVRDTFVAGPPLNCARFGHTATSLADGRLLVAGGDTGGSVEIYDPAQNVFVLLPSNLREPRRAHAALRLADGTVLLAGGIGDNGAPLDTAETFVGADTGFEAVRGWMHVTRVRPEMRLLPDGKVQIFGGDTDATMEVFDPRGRYFRALTRPALAQPLLTFTDEGPALARPPASGPSQPVLRAERQSYHDLDLPMPVLPNGSVAVPTANPSSWLVIGGVSAGGARLDSILSIPRSPATISTDRLDYHSLMTPTVGGRGWAPSERVRIVRQLTSFTDPSEVVEPTTLFAVADANGEFTVSDPHWAPYRPNAVYLLSAVGLSSRRVAQTAYYDAPQPDPTRAPVVDGPTRLEFAVPVGGGTGEVATELGTLRWSDWTGEDGTRSLVPPFDPLVLSDEMFSFLADCTPVTSPGTPCINDEGKVQVCFEASDRDDGDDGGGGTSVEGCAYLSGLNGAIWLDGSFDTRIDFDPGEGEILPELRTMSISSHIQLWTDPRIEVLVGLDLTVTFEVPLIPIPVNRSFEIADAGIRGNLTIPNLYLGVSGGVEGFTVRPYLQVGRVVNEGPVPPRLIAPVSVTPRLKYWPAEDIGVDLCSMPGDCQFGGQAGVEVVDYGDAEVKLFLQAKAGATVTADLGVAEVNAWCDLGAGPYLRGGVNLGGFGGGCEPWHVDVDAGVEAWANAGAFIQWPCVGIECDWTWHCAVPCWGGCCFGWWVPSNCEIDCPTTDLPGFDLEGDWWLDIADVWEAGELTVTAATSGLDLDPDGYRVTILPSDVDPDSQTQWDLSYTLEVPPNASASYSGETCTVWFHDEPTCDPLATFHDVEVDPGSVMWNCGLPGGTSIPGVCMDTGVDAALDIEVHCESVFEGMRWTVGQLLADGGIANSRVAAELDNLLSAADQARSLAMIVRALNGTPGPVGLLTDRRSCEDFVARFISRVEAHRTNGGISPAAADLLLDRALQIRDHYCRTGVPVATRRSALERVVGTAPSSRRR